MQYNGWTNYATWRVKLECFDGVTVKDICIEPMTDAYELGKVLREHIEDTIALNTSEGIARDYAFAFISEVNWREIAESMIEDEQ